MECDMVCLPCLIDVDVDVGFCNYIAWQVVVIDVVFIVVSIL